MRTSLGFYFEVGVTYTLKHVLTLRLKAENLPRRAQSQRRPKPGENTQIRMKTQPRTLKTSQEHPKPAENTENYLRSPKPCKCHTESKSAGICKNRYLYHLVISKTIFYQTKPNQPKICPNHPKVSYCHTESTSVGIFKNRCLYHKLLAKPFFTKPNQTNPKFTHTIKNGCPGHMESKSVKIFKIGSLYQKL